MINFWEKAPQAPQTTSKILVYWPMALPKISIVIVNFNLADYLETALRSVVEQGYPNLELIVVDGGSDDGSVEIIRRYESHLSWWVSEADQGQYHAVQKGFEQATGEIMAWLNSDDRYHHRSLWEVATIFGEFPEVEWLMGFPTEFEPGGATIHRITLPWARWSAKRYLTYDFQFIQQESCFWRRELWEKAGGHMTKDLRLAGDLELWARFFRHARLYTTMTLLGGFRYRGGEQRSRTQMQAYLDEARTVIQRERSGLPLLRRMWLGLQRFVLFPVGILFFLDIPLLRGFYEWAYGLPPVIRYDFADGRYKMSKRQVKHPPLYWKGRQIARK